jgi:hypothetical protein
MFTFSCTGDIVGAGDDDEQVADGGAAAIDADPLAPDADPAAPDAAPIGDRDAVCSRWMADRADMSEGGWSGDVATCNAGDVLDPGKANTVKLVNLYRWMSGLPPVTNSPGLDSAAQQCSLMMRANNALSHMPPDTWDCYTTEGANGAARSNISTAPGVRSIDAYMADNFAPNSLGHRRWILSNSLGTIGVGSTDGHSCLYVITGGGQGQAWTAFPPPGAFPYEAVKPFFYSIDIAGWSVQSDSIALSGAQVSITANGQDQPVTVVNLSSGFGSSSAIAMVPDGWETQPETVYHVEVTGISQPIIYDVNVVDCGG